MNTIAVVCTVCYIHLRDYLEPHNHSSEYPSQFTGREEGSESQVTICKVISPDPA